MSQFRPKYITFDCYGTLTNFDMAGAARRVYGSQLSAAAMAQFIKDFAAYRLDEVLGAWKPYAEVVHNSVERTCKRNGVAFRPEDAQRIYEEVPTWGPHPDVPAGLAKVAKEIPLVILSNSMNEPDHVERGEARRALPHGHHGGGNRRLQAADEGLRVHARQARLRTRKTSPTSRPRSAMT